MSLSTGDKIGPYEILSPLGAGGMGEVYRAKDTKLGRSVALKVLPAALANDADYIARFQREAQVLASLNHPNIAAIYGLELNAIVMELVEGRTLAEVGSLPIEEALQYARQIAEALEAAHEKGIIHRDLKPANVKVTPDGTVKVLDFGLAKSAIDETVTASPQDSPTLSIRATQAGIILGTAAYMSPEQAAGKPVDRRADIWSFGVVLFEMLSGKRLFEGESISHTLADVLRAEIDFTKLPSQTPTTIRELLRRCLDRKLKNRLQWIGEARITIEAFLANPNQSGSTAPIRAGSRLPWAAAALFAIAAIACAILAWRATRPVEKTLLRFTEDLGPDVLLADTTGGPSTRTAPNVVISPDGARLVFTNQGSDGKTRLYTRRLDQLNAVVIAGTEGALGPFFSPNGKWIGFFASRHLKKVAIDGGSPTELCDAGSVMGASWGDDGNIIAALYPLGVLSRVPETGGPPQPITKLEPGEASHRWVQVLPGAKAILFSAGIGGSFNSGKIVAQRLDSGERRVLLTRGSFPRYLASGHLVFVRDGTLFAVRFDAERLELKGSPAPVVQDVKYAPDGGGAQLDFSREGTLVYRSGGTSFGRILAWVDEAGNSEVLLPSVDWYSNPVLSRDGNRLAFRILESGRTNIWIHDIARKQTNRLTFEPGVHESPLWTPDGRHIAYSTAEGIFWTRADGTSKPVQLRKGGVPLWFTPDGKRLAYLEIAAGNGGQRNACMLVSVEGDPSQPRTGGPQPCFDAAGAMIGVSDLSPDGRWIAYASLESGDMQVFVRPFPDRGGKWQISSDGGGSPRWSAGGHSLFFNASDNRLMVVPVHPSGVSFSYGQPRPWANAKLGVASGLRINYSPSPDSRRVLMLLNESAGQKPDAHVNIALNFFDEVNRRLRAVETK